LYAQKRPRDILAYLRYASVSKEAYHKAKETYIPAKETHRYTGIPEVGALLEALALRVGTLLNIVRVARQLHQRLGHGA
jgi:hypothetical protein